MADKTTPGQPLGRTPILKAAFINDLVDMVNDFKQRGGGKPSPKQTAPWTDTVKVRNVTGAARERGQCIQLGGYLLSPIDLRNLWFDANAVAAPVASRFAILRDPLPEDEIGLAHVSGACAALVNVTDTTHTHATPAVGEYVLQSAAAGPVELLSLPNGPGEQTMVVLLRVASGEVNETPEDGVSINSPCPGTCQFTGDGSGGWDETESNCPEPEDDAYTHCRCEKPPFASTSSSECVTMGCVPVHIDPCGTSYSCAGACSDLDETAIPYPPAMCLTVPAGTFEHVDGPGMGDCTRWEGTFPLLSGALDVPGYSTSPCYFAYTYPVAPWVTVSNRESTWFSRFEVRGGDTYLTATLFRRSLGGALLTHAEWYEVARFEKNMGTAPIACLEAGEHVLDLVSALTAEEYGGLCAVPGEDATVTIEIAPESCERVTEEEVQNTPPQGSIPFTCTSGEWVQGSDCLDAPDGDPVEGAGPGSPPEEECTPELEGEVVYRTCYDDGEPVEGTIEVDCCEELLPATIQIVMEGGDCLDGVAVNLTYDGGEDKWIGSSATSCDGPLSMRLYCSDPDWILEYTCSDPPDWEFARTVTLTGFTCDPLGFERVDITSLGDGLAFNCGIENDIPYTVTGAAGSEGGEDPPEPGGCKAWACAWISNGTAWSRLDNQAFVCPPAGGCQCVQPNKAGIAMQMEFSNCVSTS